MASKLRAEFIRLRERNSHDIQNAVDVSDQAPVTKAISGTALTGAGRITCPAKVNGMDRFHVRLISDVECVVTFAPKEDAGTSYDATLTEEGGIHIPANTPVLYPVSDSMLISAVTGTFA